jgi:hypothetical protein
MPPLGIDRLLDIAVGVAIGWLLGSRRFRSGAVATSSADAGSDSAGAETTGVELVASTTASAAARSEDATVHADVMVSLGEVCEPVTRPPRGTLYLAPPPPPGSETAAHRALRLGDAPESPIHSQSPDDWEDMVLSDGQILLAPRGMRALGDRAAAAFHVRRTFHRVK